MTNRSIGQELNIKFVYTSIKKRYEEVLKMAVGCATFCYIYSRIIFCYINKSLAHLLKIFEEWKVLSHNTV